jgi:Zn-dependent M28 family amino/carboxypeptidase
VNSVTTQKNQKGAHTRTHHTNSDSYDRLVPEDLRQAAVVIATFLYNTAMRGELLPRAARPQQFPPRFLSAACR